VFLIKLHIRRRDYCVVRSNAERTETALANENEKSAFFGYLCK
jgi:hypothetical protein